MKKSACAQCGIRPHANHSSLCMYCESVNAAYDKIARGQKLIEDGKRALALLREELAQAQKEATS